MLLHPSGSGSKLDAGRIHRECDIVLFSRDLGPADMDHIAGQEEEFHSQWPLNPTKHSHRADVPKQATSQIALDPVARR